MESIKNLTNKSIKEYTTDDIFLLIIYHLPILIRVLKNNNHYNMFIKSFKTIEEFDGKKYNFFDYLIKKTSNFINNIDRNCELTWSIHTNMKWGSGWLEQYVIKEVKDYNDLSNVMFGMLLNVFGHDLFDCGYFYDDYINFKNRNIYGKN